VIAIRALLVVTAAITIGPAVAQRAVPPAPPFAATGSVQLAFAPWEDAEGMIVAAIGEARRQILVQAFSFTSRRIAAALIAAKGRGIEVLVTADHEQAASTEGSRIRELAAAGIPVWLETHYVAAHNKVMVIDAGTYDSAVVTGSFNWTSGAQRKNAENVLILRRNRELAQAYAANWQRHRDGAVRYGAAPKR